MNLFPESWWKRNSHWFNIFYLGFCHLWGLYALFYVVPDSHDRMGMGFKDIDKRE